jgi:hypothetical protein
MIYPYGINKYQPLRFWKPIFSKWIPPVWKGLVRCVYLDVVGFQLTIPTNIILYVILEHITGWWFGAFFIFPYIGNNHPN